MMTLHAVALLILSSCAVLTSLHVARLRRRLARAEAHLRLLHDHYLKVSEMASELATRVNWMR